MTVIHQLCAVPVDDWDAELNRIERPCGSEAIPGVDQQMCAAHYGRWRRAMEAQATNAKLKRLCRFCSKPLRGADRETTAHGICQEAAKDELSRARCVECNEARVGANGRFCHACVEAAFDAKTQGTMDATDHRILDFLAHRDKEETALTPGREFDDTSIEDAARAVRPGKQYAKADSLVNQWDWRHPDGFLQLGKSDMVLWPVWSSTTKRWVIFKCQRDSGHRRKFHWIPLEYVEAHDGRILSDAGWDWASILIGTGEIADLVYESRPAEFHEGMDAAWEVADRWRRQLSTMWEMDPQAMWEEQCSLGTEVFRMREVQERNRDRQRIFRSKVKLTDDGRFSSVNGILDQLALDRARKRIVSDARWDRDAQ